MKVRELLNALLFSCDLHKMQFSKHCKHDLGDVLLNTEWDMEMESSSASLKETGAKTRMYKSFFI